MVMKKVQLSIFNLYISCIMMLLIHHFLLEIPLLIRLLCSIVVLFFVPGHLFSSILLQNSLKKSSIKLTGDIGHVLVALSLSLICLSSFLFILTGQLEKDIVVPFYLLSQFFLLLYLNNLGKLDDSFFLSIEYFKINLSWNLDSSKNISLLIVSFISFLVLLSVFISGDKDEEDWTEFYVTNSDGFADSIPNQIYLEDNLNLMIGVINNGNAEEFTINRQIIFSGGANNGTIYEEINSSHSILSNSNYLGMNEITFTEKGSYLIQYGLFEKENSEIRNSLQIKVTVI